MQKAFPIEMFNVDFYNTEDAFKMLVFIADVCNYNCEYCYNHQPRTGKILDLNKLKQFIDDILFKKIGKKHLFLELIGGETTLHPQLLNFCKNIGSNNNIFTTIYTNFSKPIDYYRQLLDTNENLKLILSWHSNAYSNDFVDKLGKFSKQQLKNNITASVIFEHNNIVGSLKTFDQIYALYPYIRELSFPLIDDNENYYGRKYSTTDIDEYFKRLRQVKDLTKIKIKLSNDEETVVNQHYFIIDERNKNFNKWLCNAGIDFCFVFFDGNIYVCDGYHDKALMNIYSNDIVNFKLNNKPMLCKLDCCPCVFDVYKKNIFKATNDR